MLTEIVTALAECDGPSRELDLRISVAINHRGAFEPEIEGAWQWGMGGDELERRVEGKKKPTGYLDPMQFVPRWTASLDAAAILVPIDSEWGISVSAIDGMTDAYVITPVVQNADGEEWTESTGSHLKSAVALCLAALNARIIDAQFQIEAGKDSANG